jgi:hypothetical protein
MARDFHCVCIQVHAHMSMYVCTQIHTSMLELSLCLTLYQLRIRCVHIHDKRAVF